MGNATHCDHIIAVISGQFVHAHDWAQKIALLDAKIHFFNTTKQAVPHPGFVARCKFCPSCGAAISDDLFPNAEPVPVISITNVDDYYKSLELPVTNES